MKIMNLYHVRHHGLMLNKNLITKNKKNKKIKFTFFTKKNKMSTITLPNGDVKKIKVYKGIREVKEVLHPKVAREINGGLYIKCPGCECDNIISFYSYTPTVPNGTRFIIFDTDQRDNFIQTRLSWSYV
jgi:hypothetical protein